MELRELTAESELWQRQREPARRPEALTARPFDDGAAPRLASGLGWFSIGLGLLEVLAPHAVARMSGLDRTAGRRSAWSGGGGDYSTLLRLFGLREIGAGLGILGREQPAGWLWGRVAGDLLDLAVLGSAFASPRADRTRLTAATAAVAGVTALDVLTSQRLTAPRRSVSHGVDAEGRMCVTHTLAINRTPAECYRYWRQLENLPRFMRHLESVQVTDEKRSHWVARPGAGARLEWDAEVTEDEADRRIAWRSLPGAEMETEGSVTFEAGPKGKGTIVRLEMRYRPPAGRLGSAVARLIGRDPTQQVREDLRRFKQLLETGEIATTEGQPAGRRGLSGVLTAS